MSDYAQQTKPVCTNASDPTCKASQDQFNSLNELQAQTKADGEYDVPPSPPATKPSSEIIVQGFTPAQRVTTGLYAAAILLILYGLVGKPAK
jgi:hypothetical protein